MQCKVCGSDQFVQSTPIWADLIRDWQLSPDEVSYMNEQQGTFCSRCGANLRSIALASAVLRHLYLNATLVDSIKSDKMRQLSILEINEAGTLSPYLSNLTGHVFGAYPELDMHSMPYPNDEFDLILHSDTLEHVPNPVHALNECRRVLKPTGVLCFTVPIVVGRLSRDRTGLAKSYHGQSVTRQEDYTVHTEFGADVWTYVLKAGFSSIEVHSFKYPSALALIARKT